MGKIAIKYIAHSYVQCNISIATIDILQNMIAEGISYHYTVQSVRYIEL